MHIRARLRTAFHRAAARYLPGRPSTFIGGVKLQQEQRTPPPVPCTVPTISPPASDVSHPTYHNAPPQYSDLFPAAPTIRPLTTIETHYARLHASTRYTALATDLCATVTHNTLIVRDQGEMSMEFGMMILRATAVRHCWDMGGSGWVEDDRLRVLVGEDGGGRGRRGRCLVGGKGLKGWAFGAVAWWS